MSLAIPIKLIKEEDIYQKVGTKDVLLGEYKNNFICKEFAVLWNNELPVKILKELAELWNKHKKEKELKP